MTHPTPAPDEALREKIARAIYEASETPEPDNDALTWEYAKHITGLAKLKYPDQAKMYQGEIDAAYLRADAVLAILSPPQRSDAPVVREAWRIEYDGFEGVEIGSYTTLEGKQGVVLQQIGTRVVHVYGRRWLIALAALQPQAEAD